MTLYKNSNQQLNIQKKMNHLSKTFSPLKTMKKLTVCVILALICTGAQARNKTFDNLAKIKDVECVHINKMLLKLASMKGEDLHIGESINIGKDTLTRLKTSKSTQQTIWNQSIR